MRKLNIELAIPISLKKQMNVIVDNKYLSEKNPELSSKNIFEHFLKDAPNIDIPSKLVSENTNNTVLQNNKQFIPMTLKNKETRSKIIHDVNIIKKVSPEISILNQKKLNSQALFLNIESHVLLSLLQSKFLKNESKTSLKNTHNIYSEK